ncbi:MAG: hypothetical protein HQ402_01900 [Parcubacteria group bacterium]|nr:hypothetical protein [Parcubacteria group bacterium]
MATSTASSAQMATAPVSAPAKLERPILGNSAGAEGPHTSAIYRTQEEWLAHSQRMSNTHAEKIAADASAINGENIRGILVDQAEILTRREDVWYDRLDNLRKEQCPPAVPVVSSPPISAPAVDAVTKNDLESVRQSVVGLGTNLDGKIEAVGRSVGDLRQRLDANDGRVNALQEEMRGFQQPKPDPVSQNQTPAVAPNPVPVAPFYVAPNPPVTSGTTPCCGDEKPAPVQQSQAVVAEERYVGVVIFNGDTAVGQPMIVPESSISRVSGQVVSFTVEGESLPTLVPSGFQAVVSRGHATRSDKNASSSVVLQIGKDSMASVFLWKVWDYRRAVYYLNNDGILMKVVSGRASPARISS